VPADTPVVVHVTVKAGDVLVDPDLPTGDDGTTSSGTQLRRTVHIGTGDPVLVVDASLGMGEVLIAENTDGEFS
jgi:hypothetical protein